MNNLAAEGAYSALKQTLSEQLFSELKSQQDPRVLGRGGEFDLYPFASEKHVGLYERYLKGEKKLPGFFEGDVDPIRLELKSNSK